MRFFVVSAVWHDGFVQNWALIIRWRALMPWFGVFFLYVCDINGVPCSQHKCGLLK